jgi:hypothetical protein
MYSYPAPEPPGGGTLLGRCISHVPAMHPLASGMLFPAAACSSRSARLHIANTTPLTPPLQHAHHAHAHHAAMHHGHAQAEDYQGQPRGARGRGSPAKRSVRRAGAHGSARTQSTIRRPGRHLVTLSCAAAGTHAYYLGPADGQKWNMSRVEAVLAAHAARGVRVVRLWAFGEKWRGLNEQPDGSWVPSDWWGPALRAWWRCRCVRSAAHAGPGVHGGASVCAALRWRMIRVGPLLWPSSKAGLRAGRVQAWCMRNVTNVCSFTRGDRARVQVPGAGVLLTALHKCREKHTSSSPRCGRKYRSAAPFVQHPIHCR